MSTGRIMTLSVESLNKLYFQFIEQFIAPRLDKPLTEVSQLLKLRTAYEVHRYLEDLLDSQPQNANEHFSTQTNSSANGSTTPALFTSTPSQHNKTKHMRTPTLKTIVLRRKATRKRQSWSKIALHMHAQK
jgi:hypothetical protein